VKTKENAGLTYKQEVRGSSPRAPTIIFNNLQGAVSSNSAPLLFRQLVAELLRDQVLLLLHCRQTQFIVTTTRVIQNCSKSGGSVCWCCARIYAHPCAAYARFASRSNCSMLHRNSIRSFVFAYARVCSRVSCLHGAVPCPGSLFSPGNDWRKFTQTFSIQFGGLHAQHPEAFTRISDPWSFS